jgi:hypothetical protein
VEVPTEKQRFMRAGAKYALLCGLFGLLIAGVISAVLFAGVGIGLHEMVLIIPQSIAVAVFSLFAAAYLFGRGAGALIHRFGIRSFATPIISILLAFACAITAITAGVVTGIFGGSSLDRSLMWILQLIGTIFAFGAVPALLLGLSFWALMRSSAASHHSSRQIR